MSKLPAVKPREVIKFLELNGFILDHVSGSHFIFYRRFKNGALWLPSATATCQRNSSLTT